MGNEHGLLKKWYGSGNLQIATSNFITDDQENSSKKITLHETVDAILEG